ncbi:MAG: 6-phosphogluconolactonase [Ignavibacteriales bacterium]|nr:6-phosphogluconolactonase [Ignavibacteriales bacterium]
MQDVIRIYPDPDMTVRACAAFIARKIEEALETKEYVSIGLSGGSSPNMLFTVLFEEYREGILWDKIKFFWVDERCVAPDDAESNFGTAKKLLLDPLKIQDKNIFRIFGENEPPAEVERYTDLLEKEFGPEIGFDICLLGIGTDGHTASIFPPDIKLMESKKFVATTVNPNTGQNRITITGRLINNCKAVIFLAYGKEKKEVLDGILNHKKREHYPAGLVFNVRFGVYWYLDSAAYRLP